METRSRSAKTVLPLPFPGPKQHGQSFHGNTPVLMLFTCAPVVRSGRRRSHGVCSAQSGTTEQLLVQPKTGMGRCKSGKPLFAPVWMRIYEDEISVEGPDALRAAPKEPPRFSQRTICCVTGS